MKCPIRSQFHTDPHTTLQQELERIVKSSFRRFQHLGTEASNGATTPGGAAASAKAGRGGAGGRRRGAAGAAGNGEKAAPMPTLDQAVDDLLALVRLLGEQVRLFECTSVTETHKVRVIATAIPVTTEATAAAAAGMQPGGGKEQQQNFFMYQIRVENRHPRATVQLVGREWVIQDSEGQVSDAVPKGSIGVVGHEPILRPGAAIAYMSGARLPTQYGSMRGSFQMVRRSGGGGKEVPEKFDAVIDSFLLK